MFRSVRTLHLVRGKIKLICLTGVFPMTTNDFKLQKFFCKSITYEYLLKCEFWFTHGPKKIQETVFVP